MKDYDFESNSGINNPYRTLLHKLTGVKIPRPRLRTPADVWRKTQRGLIDEEVSRRMGFMSSSGSRRKDLVSTCDKAAREMYGKLPEVEKHRWIEQAKEEHQAALAAWQVELERKPSIEPMAREKCIQGLARFVQPILNSIVEATGWKVSLLAGGLEPADDGRLNVISIHAGTTPGDAPMNFGCAERVRYKKYIVPVFGSFLQNCYTVEEYNACALPETAGFPGLATLNLDGEGINYNRVDAAESLSIAGNSNVHIAPPTPPPLSPANPPRLHLQPTTLLNLLPAFSEDSPSLRPSSHQSPQHQSSVPRFSPVLPSCLSSGCYSGAADGRLSPLNGNAPPISSEGAAAAESSSLRMTLPLPTLPSQSSGPLPSNVNVSSASASEDIAADYSSFCMISPPPVSLSKPSLSGPRAMSDQSQDTAPSNPSYETAANDTPSTAANLNPSDTNLYETPQNDQQPIQQRSKRARSDPTDDSNSAGPSIKRTRTDTITTAASQISPLRCLRSTANASQTLPHPALTARPTRSRLNAPLPPSNTQRSWSPPPLSENSSIPEWFKSAKSMFEREPLGDQWLELVRLWSLFEEREGYIGSACLPSKSRPDCISQWIKRRRSSTWRPSINLTTYEENFQLWWMSLQHTWRIVDDAIVLANVEGDWGMLKKAGINGIVSVLAAIFFWGCHIVEVSEDLHTSMWSLAVKDCIQALSHLVDSESS